MSRTPRCQRSDRPMHPYIEFWTKDSARYAFTRWYCPDCNRKVKTELSGNRGCWYRVYSEHPREGVTNKQWQAWKDSGR